MFDYTNYKKDYSSKNKTSSGNYIIQWDGEDNNGRKVASGTYFIQLEIDGESVVKKAVVIE